jgi:hypothetical protein
MNKFTYSVNSILRSRDSRTQRHFLSSHEISNFFRLFHLLIEQDQQSVSYSLKSYN